MLIVCYFLEPKDLFVLIFTLFAKLGFVGYIHGLSISHELKTYPMGWHLDKKLNVPMVISSWTKRITF